jgi:hypothetical protein
MNLNLPGNWIGPMRKRHVAELEPWWVTVLGCLGAALLFALALAAG